VSVSIIMKWRSFAEQLVSAVASLHGDTSLSLDVEYLNIADVMANGIRAALGIVSTKEAMATNKGLSVRMSEQLTTVDRIFDEQPDNVKLVIWFYFAMALEVTIEEDSRENNLLPESTDTTEGTLIKGLRLGVRGDVGLQEAEIFAQDTFALDDKRLVADWINGKRIVSPTARGGESS
jgi:hypothetical protein